ncbi:MAG TPA: PadR family transcriptional regulator [Dongiaceae bacterium]|jgi:DNA-binding PadR family transcriptional regulator|nr:PadR family transcriptional regulator [Dongiaceae bacterium]
MHFYEEDQGHRGGRHCGGRHGRHGWGHRHGGGWFGRPGRGGGDDFRRGRKLGSGDLQLLLLHLLNEAPRHGYELIKELESRTNGYYTPSPGVIYPALTYLEEIGFASVEAEGNKKLYRITETGAAFLKENQANAETMLNDLAEIGRRFARAQRAMNEEEGGEDEGEEDEESELGTWPLGERRFGRATRKEAVVEIMRARHDLKHALREKIGAGPDEHKRIADILRRAAAEIRGEKK